MSEQRIVPAKDTRLIAEVNQQTQVNRSLRESEEIRNTSAFKDSYQAVIQLSADIINKQADAGNFKCFVPLHSGNCKLSDAKFIGAVATDVMKTLTMQEYSCKMADRQQFVDFLKGWPEAIFIEIGW